MNIDNLPAYNKLMETHLSNTQEYLGELPDETSQKIDEIVTDVFKKINGGILIDNPPFLERYFKEGLLLDTYQTGKLKRILFIRHIPFLMRDINAHIILILDEGNTIEDFKSGVQELIEGYSRAVEIEHQRFNENANHRYQGRMTKESIWKMARSSKKERA